MLKVKFGDNPLNHCAQEVENNFEIIFWTVNNLVMKTGELVHILDNIFRQYFTWSEELGTKSRPFWYFHLLQVIKNLMSFRFLTISKVCTETNKNSKNNLLKTNRLHNTAI